MAKAETTARTEGAATEGAATEAVEGGVLVQLKDTDVSFVDPDTGWSLTRDEVKPWPDNPGAATLALRNKGVIVEAADAPKHEA